MPAAQVLDVAGAISLAKRQERDLFLDLNGTQMLNAGFRFRTDGPSADRPAPKLGAQTDEFTKKPAHTKRA